MLSVLVTIGFSHFCEKARWALDRANVSYVEERYVPIVHLLGTLRRGGRSTPLLVATDGETYRDSQDIVRYAEAQRPGALFPTSVDTNEIESMCTTFDSILGPHARRVAYGVVLDSPGTMPALIRASTNGIQKTLAPVLGVVVPKLVRRGLKVTPIGVERSRVRVDEVFRSVGEILADGRKYLFGDVFTAADLTFAALASPLVGPKEHPLLGSTDLLSEGRDWLTPYAESPAGQFALRCYQHERARC